MSGAFHFRLVDRGMAILWPATAAGAAGVHAYRARLLLKGHPLKAAELAPARAAALQEVRVCGLEALAAPERRPALAHVRRCFPGAVIRVEWPLARRHFPGTAEVRQWQRLAPVFLHVLCDGPGDLIGAEQKAARMAQAGVPVAGEVFLCRGVNDRVPVLREVLLGLLRCGVRPTALVDGAWLPRTARVGQRAGLELVRGLRGWISGLAAPPLVVEGRTGRRRQVVPPYLTEVTPAGARGRNYRGVPFFYPNLPPDPVQAPEAGGGTAQTPSSFTSNSSPPSSSSSSVE